MNYLLPRELKCCLWYLKNVPISIVDPRGWPGYKKKAKKTLRLRVVHPFSWWGQHKKVFAWPAFGQHSPRLLSCSQVTISVVALLAEGCLATSNALCGLCKKENPGPVGRNYLGASPAAGWLASWVQLGKKLSEAFGNHASFLALINNTTLGFRPPVFCDERYLSKICCWSLGYSHTPMPCLFVVKWNNCHWARLGFTPHLLRENKTSTSQMCFLGNPRFPKVFLHYFFFWKEC